MAGTSASNGVVHQQPWLDGLPPEVRDKVFKLTLSSERVLLGAHGEEREDIFDIALLVALVNDLVMYDEAYDVFYRENAFRITTGTQFDDLLGCDSRMAKYMRRVEVINLADCSEFFSNGRLKEVVEACEDSLPKLRVLRLAYDGYYMGPLRDVVHSALGSKEDLVCMNVGHYMLSRRDNFDIHLRHYGLVLSWQKLQAQEGLDLASMAADLAKAMGNVSTTPTTTKIARALHKVIEQAGLTGWVTLYDTWRALGAMGVPNAFDCANLSKYERALLRAFQRHYESNFRVPGMYAGMFGGFKRLKDLVTENYDAGLMEWVSNLLVHNTRRSRGLLEHDQWYTRTKALHESQIEGSDEIDVDGLTKMLAGESDDNDIVDLEETKDEDEHELLGDDSESDESDEGDFLETEEEDI